MKKYLFVIAIGQVLWACSSGIENNSWTSYFPTLGANSSPHLADLNNDGVLDVVMGAGENEWVKTDTGVIALDGSDGHLLWHAAAPNQVVGSATFLDVTGDAIPDVFIGGRSDFLVALDGANGEVLWKYKPAVNEPGSTQHVPFNFYNPQTIPDQTGDGIPDLLVSHGGNVMAFPNTSDGREPGVLRVMDSKTGEAIAAAAMPDGKETYMSPLVHDFEKNGRLEVVFGTGGETIGGSLYRAPLADVLGGDLSKAKELHHTTGHGFIAPPVLADITGDGVSDIVTNNQGGEMLAFDGHTDSLLWRLKVEGTESSSSLAVGYFNDDEVPDFFGHYAVGAWPDNKGARQICVDGRNGHVIKEYSLGCTGFFSPVAVDLDGDNTDEVLLSVNDYNCTGIFVTDCKHYLVVFNFKKGSVNQFSESKKVKNLSTTPWVGDMDGDGLLDVVYCVQANTSNILEFYGMAVQRLETKRQVHSLPHWGGYMGPDGKGVFIGVR